MIYIVDIDKTTANNDHRLGFLERECIMCLNPMRYHEETCVTCGSKETRLPQKSWDSFMSANLVSQDEPILQAQEVLCDAVNKGVKLHFLTGRHESLREVTEAWLREYYPFEEYTKLVMRGPAMNDVPASQYKERAFKLLRRELGEDESYVFFDDDPHVLTMYAKYGLALACPEAWSNICFRGPGFIETPWRV